MKEYRQLRDEETNRTLVFVLAFIFLLLLLVLVLFREEAASRSDFVFGTVGFGVSVLWLLLFGIKWHRSIIPKVRQLVAAKELLHRLVSNAAVENQLGLLAVEANAAFKKQNEVLKKRGLREQMSDEEHAELDGVNEMVAKRKAEFWRVHNAAKSCGYPVFADIGDYLLKE